MSNARFGFRTRTGTIRDITEGVRGYADSDAAAFIVAAGITNETEKFAINNLVIDLKQYGIWNQLKAIYPMVGGTATTHKWNLRFPFDTDGAFRLVFVGGWTHSSTGATPNGTNAFASTYYNPFNIGLTSSVSLSYYSRTQIIANQIEMGITQSTSGHYLSFYNTNGARAINNATTNLFVNYNNTRGFLIGQRTDGTTLKYYKDGLLTETLTVNAGARPQFNILLGSSGFQNTPNTYSSKECAFASIGDSLTDTQAADFYTIVQTFQTVLGRNVP